MILTTVLASSASSTSTVNDVEPGLLGFLVVAALGLALVFLLRSMNQQFKKIGPKPEDGDAAETGAEGATAAASQRPRRGLAAHRAAMAAAAADADAESAAEGTDAQRDLPARARLTAARGRPATPTRRGASPRAAPTSQGR